MFLISKELCLILGVVFSLRSVVKYKGLYIGDVIEQMVVEDY
jgi:hypothetical protein